MPHSAYGVVESVNAGTRKANVYLSGDVVPSVGFTYSERSVPEVGNRVRVVIDPRGDRYIDAVFSSDLIVADSVSTTLLAADDITATGDVIAQGRVHAYGSGDVALASTLHALQAGPSGGENVAIDGNEVMSRNNGAASTLNINADGGKVIIGQNSGGHLDVRNGGISVGTTGVPPSALGILFGADVWLARTAANILELNSGDTFVGRINPTNMAVGGVSINPVANTPTGVTVNYTALTGSSFAGFASPSTSVPGSSVTEASITSVDNNSAVVYIYRVNTTTTTVFWMVWGY